MLQQQEVRYTSPAVFSAIQELTDQAKHLALEQDFAGLKNCMKPGLGDIERKRRCKKCGRKYLRLRLLLYPASLQPRGMAPRPILYAAGTIQPLRSPGHQSRLLTRTSFRQREPSGEFPNSQALDNNGKKYDDVGDGNEVVAVHGSRDRQGECNG